jgi:hypothetical protein
MQEQSAQPRMYSEASGIGGALEESASLGLQGRDEVNGVERFHGLILSKISLASSLATGETTFLGRCR